MSLNIHWDNDDHTVVRIDFTSDFTTDEFQTMLQAADEMIEQEPKTPDAVIIHLADTAHPPQNIVPLFKAALENHGEGDHSIFVFVHAGLLTRRLMETTRKVYHLDRELHFVETLNDARALIATRISPS